jgi:hypothetical protein
MDRLDHKEIFQREQREDRRLSILLYLSAAPGGKANSFIVQRVLRKLGHAVGHDLIVTDTAWLGEQGLVTVEELPGMVVARITPRGRDVAAGEVVVPGVAEPTGL